MQVVPIAFFIAIILFGIGYYLRAPLLVSLFGSLAFGATAIVGLPAVGGGSLLLFVPFAGLLVGLTALRPSFHRDLVAIFRRGFAPAVAAMLLLYGVSSAMIMPRLYAGETTVFIPSRGSIVETALRPVSGNLNQAAYFSVGILAYFAIAALLVQEGRFDAIRRSFFVFAVVNATLGTVDVLSKTMGAGDLLEPIRTAGYSMLVEVQVEGFWRIVGGYSEASTFSAATLITFTFAFVYWVETGWRPSILLAALLLVLLLLSTSTTGYAGLALMTAGFGISRLWRLVRGRFGRRDASVAGAILIAVTVMLGAFLASEKSFEPVGKLVDTTILEKSRSDSAEERFYWNSKSWQAFLDTNGFGVGLGSSRASSSIFAVVSQLGVVGTVLLSLLWLELARPVPRSRTGGRQQEIAAICASLRATGFAAIIPSAISGGGADPGILFFIILAVLLVGRSSVNAPDSVDAGRDLGAPSLPSFERSAGLPPGRLVHR